MISLYELHCRAQFICRLWDRKRWVGKVMECSICKAMLKLHGFFFPDLLPRYPKALQRLSCNSKPDLSLTYHLCLPADRVIPSMANTFQRTHGVPDLQNHPMPFAWISLPSKPVCARPSSSQNPPPDDCLPTKNENNSGSMRREWQEVLNRGLEWIQTYCRKISEFEKGHLQQDGIHFYYAGSMPYLGNILKSTAWMYSLLLPLEANQFF